MIESVDGMYTQFIKFQCNNDRIAMLDNLQTGAEVKVAFNLSGRAYTAKDGSQGYMTNLVAWKVDAGNGSQSQAPSYDSIPAPPEFPTTTTANLEHDEVPF